MTVLFHVKLSETGAFNRLKLTSKAGQTNVSSSSSVSKARTSSSSSQSHSLFLRVLSALFYGLASFFIMVINKSVLTTYHFPSFQVNNNNKQSYRYGYSSSRYWA